MQKILIVKTGNTLPSLLASKGDFEHWTLSGMGVGDDQALIVNVRDGLPLPAYDKLSGVVVTGSHSTVTDHDETATNTEPSKCVWSVQFHL